MSRNRKKDDLKVSNVQQVTEEAQQLFLIPQNNSMKLQNLNKLLLIAYLKDAFLNKPVSPQDSLQVSLYGQMESFTVSQTQPEKSNLLVTKRTQINLIQANSIEEEFQQLTLEEKPKKVIFLRGVEEKISEIQSIISLSLSNQPIFEKSGLNPVKGLIIQGPPGTGKSQMLHKIESLLPEIKCLHFNCISIVSKFVGESENKITELFSCAKSMKPSIILIDDLQTLCNKKVIGGQNSAGILNALISEIDHLTSQDQILGTTGSVSALDNTLLRSGRLDKIITLEFPSIQSRLEILDFYLKSIDHSLKIEDLQEINQNMNGFSGADIVSLLRESLIQSQIQSDSKVVDKLLIQKLLQDMQPSGLKDLILEIPKVLWSDIGGNEELKSEIQQVIEWPLKHPEAFVRMGISPSKGILLYGPPGCSKTMTAKAIATESSLNFLAIKGPELFSKYVGDSEKAIRNLFKRARLCAPCIIFFDEIDAIATQRSANTDVNERVLCQLLTEMDGIEGLKQVIIVAATNRPDILDKALTRPGRFDHLLYVGPPDFDSLTKILQIQTKNMPIDKNIDLEEVAGWLDGYSGAEACLVCREAGLSALKRDLKTGIVGIEDFEAAVQKVKPRITKELIEYYKNFQNAQKLV